MTSSSEALRGSVLRGVDGASLLPARLASDLRTSPFLPLSGVDPRLVDPTLELVVARAAEAAAEQARAEGWEQGREAGRLAGLAAAQEAAEAAARARRAQEQAQDEECRRRVHSAVDALTAAAAVLEAAEAPARTELERAAGRLAVDVAEQLVGHHLTVGDCGARDAVASALRLAPDDVAVTVHVHPDDAEVLQTSWPEAAGRAVAVVGDPTVERGGCVVDAGMRRIDAQHGAALTRMREVLGA